MVFCISIEYLINRLRKIPTTIYDGSAALTGLLLALVLPPSTPIWIVMIGALIAIGIVKQAFGGLGHNIFNPALVGRLFIAVAYPASGTLWNLPSSWFQYNALTTATVLAKNTPYSASSLDLFLGNIPGCIGETSALALLIGGLWLVTFKIIDLRAPLSFFLAIIVMCLFFNQPILFHLFSGGIMIGGIFMLTDYVTSPITKEGRIIFGACIGLLVMCIRLFSNMPEGVAFSIVIMNAFVPLLDQFGTFLHLKRYQKKYKTK